MKILFKKRYVLLALLLISIINTSCGKEKTDTASDNDIITAESVDSDEFISTGLEGESSDDANIDFEALQNDNPDVYAWISIPHTDIDAPVLQSGIADDFYTSHDKFTNSSELGAIYSEMATMRDMCDFNTILRGSSEEGGPLYNLVNFEDPDFFNEHEEIYIYIEGNLLTYEVIAAYRTTQDTPNREFDFWYPEECRKYIKQIFNEKDMGKQTREGWDGLNEYNFLLTLYSNNTDTSGKHLVVVGALKNDAAGTINREVSTGEDFDISILLEE